jgi:hypothetical protein
MFAVALLASAAVGAAAPDDEAWRTKLSWQDRAASVAVTDTGYRLTAGGTAFEIPTQDAGTQTASPLFDALFALAQQELGKSRVEQVQYSAFNNNQPIPCECLVAGDAWPWVWTRDIAYATDLALFRFDPQHARNSLAFKLSGVREGVPGARGDGKSYVVQDTGSGGSWPVSTDRVVWFLGARHLLGDAAFAGKVYKALTATLAQDRRYAFDATRGLYRGETSFLDWREQSYPAWTARNVAFIAESFALSTNVLYYEALQLAASMAEARHEDAAAYREQAAALKAAIGKAFWREDRGLYMSYVGGTAGPRTIEAYDLLGTSLAILSGVAPPERARRALANYPTWPLGTPVIWPERDGVPVFHNRSIWPFASAYALKAARALDEPARIAHELRSILRGAALAGSNMENYELEAPRGAASASVERTSATESAADAGSGETGEAAPGAADAKKSEAAQARTRAAKERTRRAEANRPMVPGVAGPPPKAWTAETVRRGPLINSRRQLWSIAAYLDAVVEGVFGVTDRGTVEPKLPRELLPMLFGDRDEIHLKLPDRQITLVRPKQLADADNLLVAASTTGAHADTRVQLRGKHVTESPLAFDRPFQGPSAPVKPNVQRDGDHWRVQEPTAGKLQLYINDQAPVPFSGETTLPYRAGQQCLSVTVRAGDGIESLPSEPVCVGDSAAVGGDWPRNWTATRDGRYRLRLEYTNKHGPIMTGITAAVKTLAVQCAGAPVQSSVLVMPHSQGKQESTAVTFNARAGQRCTFALDEGFNMSFLAQYANYTGGQGGTRGAVNAADYGDLQIALLEESKDARK